MKATCLCCDNEFSYYPSQRDGKYCSSVCSGYHRRQVTVESGQAGDIRTVRQYLKERGIYECVKCGNKGEWLGKPLALHLDHIDGNCKNHVLENLRWLCPNCHHQTDNWGVLNMAEENRHKLRTNIKEH